MTVVSDYRALLTNLSWTSGQSGDAIVLTYSFSTGATAYLQSTSPSTAATFNAVTDAEKSVVRAALAQWSAASGITFYETTKTAGDLTFGFYDLSKLTGGTSTVGEGYYPNTGITVGYYGVPTATTFGAQGGDVYFDNSYQTDPANFSDFAHAAIHEIGHALGLKHPFSTAPTGATYTLPANLDNGDETVMSYTGTRSSTLGVLDVQAIQYLYGTKAGAAHPFIEIWNPASESLTVVGSAATAQSLFGSGGNDVFYSLGANDVLSGGEGDDVYYLSGKPATVNGGTGTDTVYTGLVYSAATTYVSGYGSSYRSIYLAAYGGSQAYYNVAYLDFTNGVYSTATSTFTPYDAGVVAGTTYVSGNNKVSTVASGAVSVAVGTGDVINLTGSGSVNTYAGGVETIRLGSGSDAVVGSGQDTIFGGTGPDTIDAGSGSDTVVGGAGAVTFHAGSGNNVVFAGTGGLLYMGGTGTDLVVGRGNHMTVFGGSDGGTYFGGGNGSITAGVGAQAVLIGVDGDTLNSAGPAGDLFGVWGGTVLMSGLNSTGNDVFFGAGGTGTLTFITGSGNDVLGLGQGTNNVTLGAGHSTVFANTGTTGVSTINVGSGSADIGLGGRSVDVMIQAGSGARTLTLFGYAVGADKITLGGFDSAAAANALAGQTSSAGVTFLTLADSTIIALVGVGHASSSLFG